MSGKGFVLHSCAIAGGDARTRRVRSATKTTPHPTFSVAARRCAGRARRRPDTAGSPRRPNPQTPRTVRPFRTIAPATANFAAETDTHALPMARIDLGRWRIQLVSVLSPGACRAQAPRALWCSVAFGLRPSLRDLADDGIGANSSFIVRFIKARCNAIRSQLSVFAPNRRPARFSVADDRAGAEY